MDNVNGALVIGWDFSEGNQRDALVVMQGGRDNQMKAVSAFYNEDAHAVYDLLTGKRTLESISKKED